MEAINTFIIPAVSSKKGLAFALQTMTFQSHDSVKNRTVFFFVEPVSYDTAANHGA